jgi:hypothetical protein
MIGCGKSTEVPNGSDHPQTAVETEPSVILAKSAAAYKSLDTYEAEGTVISDLDRNGYRMKMDTTFSIKLKKPNLYLIVWTQKKRVPPALDQSGAVWNAGNQPYLYMGIKRAYGKMTSDKIALFSAAGISGGAVIIPPLFFPQFTDHFVPFGDLIQPTLEGTELIGDDSCYVISGSSKVTKKETYWISMSSYLVRKYARSFEPPVGGMKIYKSTDQQLEESIRAMGKEVTPESMDEIRKTMTQVLDDMKNAKTKGLLTETQEKISTPTLSQQDFEFKIPPGTVLKESVFGEVLKEK